MKHTPISLILACATVHLFTSPFLAGQDRDSEVFEYIVGQEDLDEVESHDHDHDHSGHGHDHSGHSHGDDHHHAGHDHGGKAHIHGDHDHAGHDHGHAGHEHVEFDPLTGRGANVGGFLFPSLYVIGTGGVFEPGASAEDFATSEHDPQNDIGFQAIEIHLMLNINDRLTGGVYGFGHQGEEDEWEAHLE